MHAEIGAAIFALNDAILYVTQSKFMHNSVNTEGIITISESSLDIQSSILDEFIGSAITGYISNMELLDVKIQNVNSRQGTSPLDCIK